MKQMFWVAGIAALIGALVAGVMTSPTKTSAVQETSYQRIIRTGELRCAYGMARPWVYVDDRDGQMKGYVYDLTNELGRRLGVKIIWDGGDVGWEGIQLALQSGKADVACSTLWQSAARGRVLAFTRPLWYNQVRLYTRVDEKRFDGGDLNRMNQPDVTLATADGGESARLAERYFPRAKTVSLPANTLIEEFFLNLTTGKVDVVPADVGAMQNFIEANPGLIKEIPTKDPLQVYPSAYAVRIEETALRDMIDSAVAELLNTGYVAGLLAPEMTAHPGSFLLPASGYQR